jgi:predicted nuclease with TOPRIM domain
LKANEATLIANAEEERKTVDSKHKATIDELKTTSTNALNEEREKVEKEREERASVEKQRDGLQEQMSAMEARVKELVEQAEVIEYVFSLLLLYLTVLLLLLQRNQRRQMLLKWKRKVKLWLKPMKIINK